MSNETECNLPEWFKGVAERTYFSVYYILTPSYFILGMFGHTLCVSAFLRQLKHDSAYMYQIVTTANEILEILSFTSFISTFYWWSGMVSEGAQWFKACYGCMWYAAKLAPLVNMFITTSMFMSLSTTADRLYALLKPFAYKNADHKRHKMVAFTGSFVVGVSTSVFDCFRFIVTWNGEAHEYKMGVDEIYVGSMTAFVLAQLRNAVRVLGLAALVASNTTLIRAYRRHNRQVAAMTASNARTVAANAKDAQRQLREKTLLVLTICDSVLTTIGTTILIAYYVAVYISPSFTACQGPLMAPLLDGSLQVIKMANFYIVFAINKQFRDMVGSAVPACCRFKTHKGATVSHNSVVRQISIVPPAFE